ncbi:MAG: hypothetical protein HC880_20275, partial [Bacteroidia bacterium]|nr:hypothetical protein [Bacteroidia bacterium]
CDCIKPSLSPSLDAQFETAQLDSMVTDRDKRRAAVQKIILNDRQTILRCYQASGQAKGVRLLEKILDKLHQKSEESSDEVKTL